MVSETVKFTLEIEKGEHGLWYVTSPEIGGLLATGKWLCEIGQDMDEALHGLASAGNETAAAIIRADCKEEPDG